MQKQLTVWALNAARKITEKNNTPIYQNEVKGIKFDVHVLDDSLWIVSAREGDTRVAFRTAFSPGGMSIDKITKNNESVKIHLKASIGSFSVDISFPPGTDAILHYQTLFKASAPLTMPYWPKDVLVLKKDEGQGDTDGELFVKQLGIRSGIIYAGVKAPEGGSFLYFQNLTSLNDYCAETETSVGDTVSGEWPEFGFSLPATKEKPLPANKEFIISDAYVSFGTETPADQFGVATAYINHLAAVYRLIPKPETKYQPYLDILNYSLQDLDSNKGCWSQHKGCSYLNAYVCDYSTPPEIMVQLAVLLPMWDHQDWSGEKLKVASQIYDNIHTFWNDELQTVKRWLPSVEDQLDESEEQKVPNTMDSWYLHHPLLNLARMALRGDEMAKDLFLKSVDYAIKVARHFNYKWPVFYNMKTLETLKEETKPGMGGEKDVAGVYSQVMLQAWDLTGDKRFYEEAEKAAKSIIQFGFDMFYQANNVAFSMKAFLRLYKETSDKTYLDLCHLCVANLLKNVAIWECEYGYGKNFPMFFGLFPLNDAPYLAVYEEQVCFAAIHDALTMAEGTDFSENAKLLLAEYVKYMINRAAYYYPPMLPKEMLSEESASGELDPKLWVALEDMHDGWGKCGTVGQEVYGAGMTFGIVPRHYIRIPGQPFMVYIEYPTGRKQINGDTLTVTVLGSNKFSCRLCIIKTAQDAELPELTIMTGNNEDQNKIERQSLNKDNNELQIHGGQTIIIKWANKS